MFDFKNVNSTNTENPLCNSIRSKNKNKKIFFGEILGIRDITLNDYKNNCSMHQNCSCSKNIQVDFCIKYTLNIILNIEK